MASYRTVLQSGEFRAVLAAQVVTMLAVVGADVALAVLVYQRTGSPLLAAVTFAVGFVPIGIGSVLFADLGRSRPVRDLLVACELAVAALVALMSVPGAPIPLLLVLLATKGLIDPVFSGARAATLPELLGADGFPLGRSLLRVITQNAQLVGFAAGGTALVFVTPAQALLVAATAHVASALILLVGTRRRPVPGIVDGAVDSVVHGAAARAFGPVARIRMLFRVPGIRPVLALTWLTGFFAVAPEALAVPYVGVIGGGTVAAGLLLAGLPLGSVLGELLAGTLLTPQRRTRLMLPAAVLWFVPMLGFVLRPSLVVAVSLLVVAGTGTSFFIALDQLVLATLPEDVRRATFTLLGGGTMVTQGLGFAAAGALAELLPVPAVVPLAALGGIAVVLAAGAALRRCRMPVAV